MRKKIGSQLDPTNDDDDAISRLMLEGKCSFVGKNSANAQRVEATHSLTVFLGRCALPKTASTVERRP